MVRTTVTDPASTAIDTTRPTPAVGESVDRLAKFRPQPKRKKLIIAGITAVAVGIVGTAVVIEVNRLGSFKRATSSVTSMIKPSIPAAPPPTAPSPLTGLPVDPGAAKQPIVGIMIENLDPDARPQSGLSDAGVVYDALAEGGITRFLALFQEPVPSSIGPIRSLRPYYLDWGLEFDAPVIHAGGSQPALAAIGPRGLKNVEALVLGSPYFTRTSDRLAPHNLYTSTNGVSTVLAKLKFDRQPTFNVWPRKADSAEATPSHPTIDIDFGSASYNVKYTFDSTSNSYARELAGKPHVDRNSGQQIMVKNVVVEFVPTSYSTQEDGKPETNIALIGSGQALVFEDGGKTDATWKKTSDTSQTQLIDGNGQPIQFNRGNSWIEVVPSGNIVTD